jgi:hypothetical protein
MSPSFVQKISSKDARLKLKTDLPSSAADKEPDSRQRVSPIRRPHGCARETLIEMPKCNWLCQVVTALMSDAALKRKAAGFEKPTRKRLVHR